MDEFQRNFQERCALWYFKSHKKPEFHPLFRRHIFQKTTGGEGGVKLSRLTPAVLELKYVESYEGSYSKKYQDHVPCRFALKNAAFKFIKAILKENEYCKKVMKKTI